MLRGLPASVLLHVGVFATGYIVVPQTYDPIQQIEIVPVDIVSVSEVTNVKAVTERRTELPPAEEPTPEPEPEEVPEERPEDLELPPEEAPLVEEDTVPPPPEKVEEQAPEDIVPEEPEDKDPEPEPDPEPEEEKPERDALDDLLDSNLFQAETSTLIDRAAKQAAKAPPPPPVEETPPPENLTSQAGRRGVGERTANEARVESLLWSQMRVCWEGVDDLPDPERLAVKVRVKLNPDGTMDGDAKLVPPRRARIGDRFMQQAIDRALRAARRCAPYQMPEDDYDVWNEITMNFGTKR